MNNLPAAFAPMASLIGVSAVPTPINPADVGPKADPSRIGPAGSIGPRTAPTLLPAVGTTAVEGGKAPIESQVVQLDPMIVMEIELIVTKRKLAEADERLAYSALQDARNRKAELVLAQDQLLARIGQQAGIEKPSKITLLDQSKGLCQVE